MPITVAAFDWDGTLTVRDCVVPFLMHVAGPVSMGLGLSTRPRALLAAAAARDRNRWKELGVAAALTGRSVDEIEQAGRRFAERVSQRWLRPDTLSRLRWHQACGHRVVIVSASLSPYLEPLAAQLGVDGVMCTRLEVADDRYTGALLGPNCRGIEKLHRLRLWCSQWGDDVSIDWAYGDSTGDDDLLSAAHQPVRVGRRRVSAVPPGWQVNS